MPKHPVGRPSTYTKEKGTEICQQLAKGKSLRSVCKADGMPEVGTIFDWFLAYPEFQQQYARAKQESADALAEEVLDIADDMPKEVKGVDKSDMARIMAQRVRIDTRKWLMAKMKPKKYGEKLDVTSGGETLNFNVRPRKDGDKPAL